MDFYNRRAWSGTDIPDLAKLSAKEVRGIAVHYTGSTGALGQTASLELSVRRLKDELRFHTDSRGWSDIAYSYAIDQAGRAFELRGPYARSAANGDESTNRRYLAVTFLIGAADTPTPAALQAFAELRQKLLGIYPAATAVVGHRDLYSTECPGGALYALVRSGQLTQPPEDDMAITDAEIDAIATRTRDKILAVTYGTDDRGRPFTLAALWGELRVNLINATKALTALASAVAEVKSDIASAKSDVAAVKAAANDLGLRIGK